MAPRSPSTRARLRVGQGPVLPSRRRGQGILELKDRESAARDKTPTETRTTQFVSRSVPRFLHPHSLRRSHKPGCHVTGPKDPPSFHSFSKNARPAAPDAVCDVGDAVGPLVLGALLYQNKRMEECAAWRQFVTAGAGFNRVLKKNRPRRRTG